MLSWSGNLWGVAIMAVVISAIMLWACISLPKRSDQAEDQRETVSETSTA